MTPSNSNALNDIAQLEAQFGKAASAGQQAAKQISDAFKNETAALPGIAAVATGAVRTAVGGVGTLVGATAGGMRTAIGAISLESLSKGFSELGAKWVTDFLSPANLVSLALDGLKLGFNLLSSVASGVLGMIKAGFDAAVGVVKAVFQIMVDGATAAFNAAAKAEREQLKVNAAFNNGAPVHTFTAAIDGLGKAWNDLLVTIGNAIVKNHAIVGLLDVAKNFIEGVTGAIGKQHIGFTLVTGAAVLFAKGLSYAFSVVNLFAQGLLYLMGIPDKVRLVFAQMISSVTGGMAGLMERFASWDLAKKWIPGVEKGAEAWKNAAAGASNSVAGLKKEVEDNARVQKQYEELLGGTARELQKVAKYGWENRNTQIEIGNTLKKQNDIQLEYTAGCGTYITTTNNVTNANSTLVTSQKTLSSSTHELIAAQTKLANAPIPTKLGELYRGLSKDIWESIPKFDLPAPPPVLDVKLTNDLTPLINGLTTVRDMTLETKKATFDWAKTLEHVAGIFTGLGGMIGGATGKKLTELGGIVKSGSEAGNKLASAFKINEAGKWDSADFTGKNGAGAAVTAYAGAASAAIGAAGQIADATNVKGRGQRAMRGAAAGAAIGANPALAAATMGISVGAGAAIGALVGALRNPAFEDVFNRVAKNFGVKISDETAKAIATLAKTSFKGDRQAAEIFSLDKIISEAGGVTDKNVKLLTDRLRDAFSMKETGKFTGEQLTETLNKNFGSFAEHVKKSKDLATKSFQDIIALNQRFGAESEAVQTFVKGQTEALGGSIAALAAPLAEQYGGLAEKITEAQTAVNTLTAQGKIGTEEYSLALATLTGLQEQQRAGAVASTEEFERLGLIALAAFNASIQGGTDYVTAVEAMKPALGQLIQLQTDLGITTQNAALAELTSFSERVEANKGLVNATAALGETMRALASIGGLNTDTLAAMEEQGLQTFDRLIDAGFSESQALQQMKDYLLNVVQAHEQLGIPIDDNTGKLIEMAAQQGILKADGQSMTEILKGGFDTLTAAVTAVARALGAEIPAAADRARQAIDGIPNEVDVNVNYRQRGYPGDGGGNADASVDGYAKGTGGFRNFGSGTLAMLHGWEAVIPMNQLRGGGSGQGVEVNVWLNDQVIARAAARGLPALLDVYGATR